MSLSPYEYIAINNPRAAVSVCKKYGWDPVNVRSKRDIGTCLEQVVNAEGEDALRDIMSLHPDKDVLLELFATQPAPEPVYSNMDGGGASVRYSDTRANEHYMNFSAQQLMSSSTLINVTVVAAALLLATAIITTHK